MKIEAKQTKRFEEHTIKGENFSTFLISDAEIEKLETPEELENALTEQKLHLAQLIADERDLLYSKERFLRAIAILEYQLVTLLDQ